MFPEPAETPKTHLMGKAYQTIKEWIISYRLKPGAQLGLGELSEALQMSQTPVREALIRLELEHFIRRTDSKRFVVSEIDITDIEEIYELRIILEVQAARQAAAGMTKNELANTSEILLNAKALTAEGRRAEAIEHDHQFHSMVMKACQNFLLSEIGARILDRVIMIQNLNILTSDRLTIANAHHDEIFNAIAERDGDKAASLMSDHLVSAKEFVIQRLRSEQDILPRLLSTISSVTRRRQRN